MDSPDVAALNQRITRLTRWNIALGVGCVLLGAIILWLSLWPSPPSYAQDRYSCQMETKGTSQRERFLWTRCMETRGWNLAWMEDYDVRDELAGKYWYRGEYDEPRPATAEEKEQKRQRDEQYRAKWGQRANETYGDWMKRKEKEYYDWMNGVEKDQAEHKEQKE